MTPWGSDAIEPKIDEGGPDEGLSADDAWIELSVTADSEAVEVVSEILSRVAPGGVAVEPGFELINEGLDARIDPTRPATILAHIPARDPRAVNDALRTVTEALGHLRPFELRAIGELETRVVHESDWAESWKAHFPVLRVGRRLVIKPTWREHDASPGDVVLVLDPGMAFGTGLHPTTRLCLAALERLADDGRLEAARVLDVGCGSGILGIAAGHLGAREVLGLDTDPIAIEATLANARRNGLERRFRARRGSLPSRDGPFDVVLANLIASLLVDVAQQLADEVSATSTLVASGIFIDREPEVREALAAAGLTSIHRDVEGDWVALTAQRGAPGGAATGPD